MAIVLDPHTTQHLEIFQTLTPIEQSIVTEALQQITSATTGDPTADVLAESIAGKTFTRQERIQLEMDTLARHFQHRRQLLARSLSASQVAKHHTIELAVKPSSPSKTMVNSAFLRGNSIPQAQMVLSKASLPSSKP
jgi:hypothetical protein